MARSVASCEARGSPSSASNEAMTSPGASILRWYDRRSISVYAIFKRLARSSMFGSSRERVSDDDDDREDTRAASTGPGRSDQRARRGDETTSAAARRLEAATTCSGAGE